MAQTIQIRIGAMEGFRDLVFELGGDPTDILRECRIDETLWQTPDAKILTQQYRMALNIAAERTLTPRFGLLLSQRQSFNKFGAIGYMISHAPDLQTALKHLSTYLRMHDSGTISDLVIEDGIALMTHTLVGVRRTSTIQQTDLGCGLVLKFIRNTINPNWAPDAVYFEHSRPRDISLYHRVFRCPTFFDCDHSGIEFPAKDLQLPIPTADSKLYAILKNHVQQISEKRGDNIIERVRMEILKAIEDDTPTLDVVARRLNMDRSELQRRLKRKDTNFQSLLEDVRFGMARKFLLDTDIPMASITVILGYAEPAVFSRAFKRLSGVSPRDWRLQNRGSGTIAS